MIRWLPRAEAAKALGIPASRLRDRAVAGRHQRKPDPKLPHLHLYAVEDGGAAVPKPVEVPQPAPRAAPPAPAWEAALRALVEPTTAGELEDAPPSDFDEDTTEVPKWRPPTPGKAHSIAWISDVHVPEHDVAAVNAWLAWVRDVKPDEIILGGDIAEMGSCSEHGGVANPLSLIDDVKALRVFLDEVREAAPHAKLTYLEGNHETRFKRIVVHKLPTWDGALDIPSLCDFKGLGISWHEYGRLVQRGKLRFTHGAYANEHHAANHLRRFGCSIVYGHTHRGQTFTRATADMEMQAAFGMPSMRSLQPEWLGGSPSGWGHGFGFFLVLPDGSFTAYTPFITRGRFVWTDGTVYDGNVK